MKTKAARTATATCGTERAEFEHRWGIQDDDVDEVHNEPDGSRYVKVRLVPMILDLEKSYHDNFIMVSNVSNDWLFKQPESHITGVSEGFKVAVTSHCNGIVGGIGSLEHTNALNAVGRFRNNSTENERFKAVQALCKLLKRLHKEFGGSNLLGPSEQAATTEEIINFYGEHSSGVSTMVQ